MPGKIFIDTNVVVYSLGQASTKVHLAAPLFVGLPTISTQVLSETANVAFNPDYPLGRHSGLDPESSRKTTPRSGQNQVVVPLAWEFFIIWIPGRARNDIVFANG